MSRIIFDESEMTARTADNESASKKKRQRSKSVVRASKRRDGVLQSQQQEAAAAMDDWDAPGVDRGRAIAAAMEANTAFASGRDLPLSL